MTVPGGPPLPTRGQLLVGFFTHEDSSVRLAGLGELSEFRSGEESLAALQGPGQDQDQCVAGLAKRLVRQWRARLGRTR